MTLLSDLTSDISKGNIGNVLLKLKEASIRDEISKDDTNDVLNLAALYGHLLVVQELLKIESVKDNAAANNNEALCLAAQNGHLQVVLELLEIESVKDNAAAEDNEVLRRDRKSVV